MLRLIIEIGEVKKMSLNEIGNNVRKATDIVSSKIFRVIKQSRSQYPIIPGRAELVENIHAHTQGEKIMQKIECRRSRAIEFLCRVQNR